MRKIVALCMSAILMTSSVFASFPDVSDTFWGKDVITKWSDLEIVKGDDAGNFRPNDNITRAEFSVILNKLMKYNKATENQFEDVKSSDWFYEDIGALAQAGVMAGTEGNALPKQNITRQDAVVLMAKAFNIAPSDTEYGFSDSKQISSYARGYVNAMAKLGKDEFNKKYSEKIVDNDDLLIELMEDIADSVDVESEELEKAKAELDDYKAKYDDLKSKYKERFLSSEDIPEEKMEEKLEEKEVVDIKEI